MHITLNLASLAQPEADPSSGGAFALAPWSKALRGAYSACVEINTPQGESLFIRFFNIQPFLIYHF